MRSHELSHSPCQHSHTKGPDVILHYNSVVESIRIDWIVIGVGVHDTMGDFRYLELAVLPRKF